MDIRTAKSDEADEIASQWVALASGQREYGSHILPDANRSTARDAVLRHIVADELTVAVEDGELLGFVMFTVESGEFAQDTTRGLVRNIYVTPAERNRGVGTALLETAESALLERGAERLTLEVMADNEPARQFYRHHGYTPHRVTLEKSTENDTH